MWNYLVGLPIIQERAFVPFLIRIIRSYDNNFVAGHIIKGCENKEHEATREREAHKLRERQLFKAKMKNAIRYKRLTALGPID